ncbi:MAG: methylmalonyl Co-A mutase-associated GTPase MeaB [Acidimicrobiia bacterium]
MSRREQPPEVLFAAAGSGDRAALARLLSMVERGGDAGRSVGRLVYPQTGRAYTVGITGAPGAGKSTLVGRTVGALRALGDEVAVLAVDPSSPFTGGAVLGDRVRLQEHALDPGVFIRSMASRGHLGGLALATPEAVRVLDATGFAWVLLETVGVGQVEVAVAATADTTVVVVNPRWGDAVQAAKAGLLEVADLFVVNKADRPGADDTKRDLEHMLDLSTDGAGAWRPPVLSVVAATGAGLDEFVAAVSQHRAWLVAGGLLEDRRSARLVQEIGAIAVSQVAERVRRAGEGPKFADLRAAVVGRRLDPWTAADELLSTLAGDG